MSYMGFRLRPGVCGGAIATFVAVLAAGSVTKAVTVTNISSNSVMFSGAVGGEVV